MGRSWSAVRRGLPVPTAVRGYRRGWLRPDLLAGLTVAAYLVPQVMAYAEVAGLPPVVGLWAIVGPLAAYAVLGSSRLLSVGPESTTALMTAVAVAPLAAGDPARYAALAALLALLVGALCVLGWALRLGFLADLLSRPVLVGYLAGVAVIMIVGQLGKVTRVPVDGGSLVAELGSFGSRVGQVHLPTLALGSAVLGFLLLAGWRWPRLPGPLLGVLLASGATVALSLRDHGVRVVGAVPAGPPTVALPAISWSDVAALLLAAVGVALVGYSDNVLTARAFADRPGTEHRVDANAELLALGAANLTAGLTRGFPVSSSGSRTAIAHAVGARSQVYSVVALVAVLAVLVAGSPVLAAFPVAALGALVIYAALRLVELGEFRRFAAFRRSELVLALATTAAVVVLGVLYGVLVAIGLSILDLLRRVARPPAGTLGYVPGLAGMHDIDDHPGATVVPGLVAFRYDAPLCFANAEDFRTRAIAAVAAAPTPTRWFLLNSEANVEVDITAVDALEDLRSELDRRGVVFSMARVKQDLRDQLQAAGLVDRVGPDLIFPTLPAAVHAYVRWYAEHVGPPPIDLRTLPPAPS